MTDLVDRAEAVWGALRDAETEHLPEPRSVDLNVGITSPNVRLQMLTVAEVAAWAGHHDVPVTFTEYPTYVAVAADLVVADEVHVKAWAHMQHADAFRLLQQHGLELGPETVEVDAASVAEPVSDN